MGRRPTKSVKLLYEESMLEFGKAVYTKYHDGNPDISKEVKELDKKMSKMMVNLVKLI